MLLTGIGFTDAHLAALRQRGFDVTHVAQPSRDELDRLIPLVTHYVLGGDERLDGELLEKADRLTHVAFVGGNAAPFIDMRTASRRNIRISTSPGLNTDAVAEHSIGLL